MNSTHWYTSILRVGGKRGGVCILSLNTLTLYPAMRQIGYSMIEKSLLMRLQNLSILHSTACLRLYRPITLVLEALLGRFIYIFFWLGLQCYSQCFKHECKKPHDLGCCLAFYHLKLPKPTNPKRWHWQYFCRVPNVLDAFLNICMPFPPTKADLLLALIDCVERGMLFHSTFVHASLKFEQFCLGSPDAKHEKVSVFQVSVWSLGWC